MESDRPPPVSVEIVYATLCNTQSLDTSTRTAAEEQLRSWERDAAPGFIGDLVKVISEVNSVPEEIRLLAAVVAKNAVGSSWRKVLASREWSRVPDEERRYVRDTLTMELFQDPSKRVAVQLMLLITNIARFDVPSPWDALLPTLGAGAAPSSGMPPPLRQRALKALKFVLGALQEKQFMLERHNPVFLTTGLLAGPPSPGDSSQDLDTLLAQSKALLPPLRQQWQQAAQTLLTRGQGWEEQGVLCASYLSALRELLRLLPGWEGVEEETRALLQEGCQAAAACAGVLFAGQTPAAGGETGDQAFKDLVGKCWERLLQCALAALNSQPLRFAAYVPSWITLCINTALLGMDARAVCTVRSKSRVLLTRFVAQVLLCRHYRGQDPLAGGVPLHLVRPGLQEQLQAAAPDLKAASDCLDSLLSEQEGRCAALVQALVSKYIALSQEELQEWEADPEGFARQVDVETSPEADTPRPCGVALLECMLERRAEPVAAALLAMAGQLQSQALSAENILLREATYRAIGEVFPHVQPQVDFGSWYQSELRMMLTSQELTGLHGNILRARALWLLGVCGGELQPAPWTEAFQLCVQHVQSPDLVVALLAVSAVTASLGHVLEEQQFVQRPHRDKRLVLEGPMAAGIEQEEEEDVAEACTSEFNAHLAAVEGCVDAIMVGCFTLLPRLGEVESMVRVLQCVSVCVELMGDRVRPHLGTITTALPEVWRVITQRSGDTGGALARLHSALIGVLTHLIARLGVAAMQDGHVAGVLLPLLQHATNLGSAESEPLIEDGLRLWQAVLGSATTLPPQLQELMAARIPAILRRGQDSAAVYGIVEGHLLLGGVEAIAPLLPTVAAAIVDTLSRVLADAGRHKQPAAQQQLVGVGRELVAETAAALSLLSVMQRVFDASGSPLPPEVQSGVVAAAGVAAYDFGGGGMRLPGKMLAVMEACFEVITRAVYRDIHSLAAVLSSSQEAEARLLDRWIALSGGREIGELFVPALAAMGRSRRHDAVVGVSALLVGDATPGMRELSRGVNAIILGLKCLGEAQQYQRDQDKLSSLKPADPEHEDQLLLRRLLLLRADPLARVDVREAVKAAAAKVMSQHGREAVLQALEAQDPMYREQAEGVAA